MSSDIARTEQWVCIGKRINDKSRLAQYWSRLAGADVGEERFSVGLVFIKGATPGSVYIVSITDTDKIITRGENGPRFETRLAPDNPLVMGWDAEDKASKTRHARMRSEKGRNEESTEIDDALELLRTQYSGLRTRADQAGFLAYAIASITKPVRGVV